MTGLTFALPWFALAGAVAALAMVAAHFIAVRTGRPRPLPTARFVERAAERAVVVQRRPTDPLLLALRAGAVMLAGLALARPVMPIAQREPVTVVIAHLAGALDTSEALQRAQSGSDDRVIVSRSSSLTAPLIQALQQAAALGSRGHPVSLRIVSALAGSGIDSATLAVRSMWPGQIELERVPRVEDSARVAQVRFASEADDPLRFGLGLLPVVVNARDTVVITRDIPTGADSATAVRGHAVVHWPVAGGSGPFEVVDRPDTIHGVTTGSYTLVAEFPRPARLREPAPGDTGWAAVVWWVDGEPAAVESRLGEGCVRHVGFAAPDAGDLVISAGFQRILRSLVAPCDVRASRAHPSDAAIAQLAGTGPREALLRPAFASATASIASPLLLAAALVLLLIEMLLRRRRG
jgi:hypothetical protein